MSNLSFNAATFFPTVFPPRGITVADVNGDSKSDLLVVVGGGIDADVAVLLGNGNGTFQPPSFFPVGIAPLEIVAADFNGDGKLDLVSTDEGANNVAVLINDSNVIIRGILFNEMEEILKIDIEEQYKAG